MRDCYNYEILFTVRLMSSQDALKERGFRKYTLVAPASTCDKLSQLSKGLGLSQAELLAVMVDTWNPANHADAIIRLKEGRVDRRRKEFRLERLRKQLEALPEEVRNRLLGAK